MKSLNKQAFRATVSKMETTQLRDEQNCSHCGERFHITELVNLKAEYKGLKYDSLACVTCQKGIHLVVEAKTILKKGANES